jgi:signal peptide peptidase SppA
MEEPSSQQKDLLWVGTETSFAQYMSATARGADREYTPPRVEASSGLVEATTTNSPDSRLLSVRDGVAVLAVQGTLTNRDVWWNKYEGLIAYSEIIEAAHEALADPEIEEVVLYMDSPGGAVSGLSSAYDALFQLGQAKPMTAYSDSEMQSGGMWLGSAASKGIYAAPVAILGSIGVVLKHTEYSKALAQAGVTTTVVRAGEFKQLANDVEPLSPKAKGTLQDIANHVYGVFVQTIATARKVSLEVAETTMAGGRVFVGSQAEDAGLIDGIRTFDQVFNAVAARVAKNNSNFGALAMKKTYMTAAAAALAASGVVPASDANVPASDANVPAPDANVPAPDANVPAPDANVPAPDANVPAPDAKVVFLPAQVKEKDAELLEARMELRSAQVEGAHVAALKLIAVTAINNMVVALGGSAGSVLDADAATLVAQHASTSARFLKEFPVGGRSAANSEVAPVGEAPPVSRMQHAVHESVSIKKPVK